MSQAARGLDRLDPAKIRDIDLGSDHMRQNALRGICAEWATQPPFYVVNSGIPQVVVGRYNDLREVSMDNERFSTNLPDLPGFERIDLFNGLRGIGYVDGADHDRLRRLMTPAFGPAALKRQERDITGIIDKMLDEVEAKARANGGDFDAMNDFAAHLVTRILLEGILGATPAQQKAYVDCLHAFSLLIALKPGEKPPAAYVEAANRAIEATTELVDMRRADPGEDFVSLLTLARDQGDQLTDREVIENILSINTAGLGATAVTTGAMLMTLCKHPDQFGEVKRDPSLIPDVVDECVRMHGPGFFAFPRYAKVDTEVGGTPILKNMPVHISIQAASFDPEAYPDPLTFDIRRKPKNIPAFGFGMHHCIGNRMGRMILGAVLAKVIRRFPDLRLQDPDYVPVYGGIFAELSPNAIPMNIGQIQAA